MAGGRVVVNRAALDAFHTEVGTQVVDRAGSLVAERAADLAPKETGAGAASIHHEVELESGVPVAKVSWEPDYFYLLFHELGTSRMPARPFLRPALDGAYQL